MLRCGKTPSCASTCSCSCSCRCKALVHANTHAHIHIHTRTCTCTCNAHAHTCDVRVLILMTEFEHVVPYAAPRRQEPSTAQCMSATPPSPSRTAAAAVMHCLWRHVWERWIILQLAFHHGRLSAIIALVAYQHGGTPSLSGPSHSDESRGSGSALPNFQSAARFEGSQKCLVLSVGAVLSM